MHRSRPRINKIPFLLNYPFDGIVAKDEPVNIGKPQPFFLVDIDVEL
jgi:hypothetical protein